LSLGDHPQRSLEKRDRHHIQNIESVVAKLPFAAAQKRGSASWGTAVEIALPAVARAKSVREHPTGGGSPAQLTRLVSPEAEFSRTRMGFGSFRRFLGLDLLLLLDCGPDYLCCFRSANHLIGIFVVIRQPQQDLRHLE